MKKGYLLILLTFITASLFSQTLITYGKYTVSKDDFLRAYNKNKTPVTDKKKSLTEYLELYTNFKLKVRAAMDMRLDTLPQLKADVENFRQQVQDNYTGDDKIMKALMDEAYERSKKDLHAMHFSVTALDPAKPDSLKEKQAADRIYDQLKSGNTNYETLVQVASLNEVKAKSGDLGFITAFSVPYEYESIIYSLKPGEVSKPYRVKNTWHIFKLLEERPAAGKWKVAQILFALPPADNPIITNQVQKKADSVYGLLITGADFGQMTKSVSDDKLTYMTNGEMAEFGTGKYDYSFEKEVFQLKNNNDITKPFRTPYGFHIVKRLEQTPIPSDKNDPALSYELRQKMLQDARINIAKEKLAQQVMQRMALKKSPAVSEKDLYRYADSVMANPSDENIDRFPLSKAVILTYNGGKVKGSEWLQYGLDLKNNPAIYKGETGKELWNNFQKKIALDYYKKNLEEFNPEFRNQMQEFKEGNMLFEAMERNVWGKASTDTAGLRKQYEANKQDYKWGASADVLIFNCNSENAANEVKNDMKSGISWKDIATETSNVQVDSGRYEIAQLSVIDMASVIPGTFAIPNKNQDGTVTMIYYLKTYPADQQRTFEEARGLVINDYQIVLEKKWIASLRKKYPVKINEPLFNEMLK